MSWPTAWKWVAGTTRSPRDSRWRRARRALSLEERMMHLRWVWSRPVRVSVRPDGRLAGHWRAGRRGPGQAAAPGQGMDVPTGCSGLGEKSCAEIADLNEVDPHPRDRPGDAGRGIGSLRQLGVRRQAEHG